MQVSTEQFERARNALPDGNRVYQVFWGAAKRAMITARSKVWEAVHEVYTVKQREFYKQTQINIHTSPKSSRQMMSAEMVINGHLMPLVSFRTQFDAKNKSHTKKVEVFSGIPKDLRHAFKANFGTYGNAIYERFSNKGLDIEQMYGPSAAHMAYNADVIGKIDKAAQETFDERFDHEIERILRGYGT